jgi:hypothetical protein
VHKSLMIPSAKRDATELLFQRPASQC